MINIWRSDPQGNNTSCLWNNSSMEMRTDVWNKESRFRNRKDPSAVQCCSYSRLWVQTTSRLYLSGTIIHFPFDWFLTKVSDDCYFKSNGTTYLISFAHVVFMCYFCLFILCFFFMADAVHHPSVGPHRCWMWICWWSADSKVSYGHFGWPKLVNTLETSVAKGDPNSAFIDTFQSPPRTLNKSQMKFQHEETHLSMAELFMSNV